MDRWKVILFCKLVAHLIKDMAFLFIVTIISAKSRQTAEQIHCPTVALNLLSQDDMHKYSLP